MYPHVLPMYFRSVHSSIYIWIPTYRAVLYRSGRVRHSFQESIDLVATRSGTKLALLGTKFGTWKVRFAFRYIALLANSWSIRT
jgi:hypothetical protein